MPIGVFDSGLGGLTVLAALRRRMPDQGFVYFGDTANAPYGERSPQEITDLTLAGTSALFSHGCRLVILACNTASAVALRPMQEYFVPADRRALSVLVPLVEHVAGRSWMDRAPPGPPAVRRVLFFATPATVASGAFPREVALRARGVEITQVPCPGLVEALEAGERAQVATLVSRFVAQGLAAMPDPGAVILGCTHYPLARDLFADAVPAGAQILDQGRLVADSLRSYLDRTPGLAGPGPVRCLTSGDPARVTASAAMFLEDTTGITFAQV